jgi:TRAP-type C4-dicarboxylate transport system substrate-binding protein
MRKSAMSLALAGVLVGTLTLRARAEDTAKYTINWVVIHSPSVAAEKSAENFKAKMEKATNGEVRVNVITLDKYTAAHPGTSTHRAVLEDLQNGQAQIAQEYTAGMGAFSKAFLAINQPYLFRDYDHAETVIEGPLGKQILASLPKSSGLRGLGITYSGGYGIFATKGHVVRKPEDMRGLRLQSDRFPWMTHYEKLLGIEPVSAPPEAFVTMSQNGFVDAVETTVARFEEYGDDRGADTVIATNHFMLTTMIVVNEKFYQSLPEKYRTLLDKLTTETAREERQLSIKANEDGRVRLEKRGVKFIDLTSAERKRFAEVLAPMYQAQNLMGAEDLINAIRNTKTALKTAAR